MKVPRDGYFYYQPYYKAEDTGFRTVNNVPNVTMLGRSRAGSKPRPSGLKSNAFTHFPALLQLWGINGLWRRTWLLPSFPASPRTLRYPSLHCCHVGLLSDWFSRSPCSLCHWVMPLLFPLLFAKVTLIQPSTLRKAFSDHQPPLPPSPQLVQISLLQASQHTVCPSSLLLSIF